jgi:hypothetical protein
MSIREDEMRRIFCSLKFIMLIAVPFSILPTQVFAICSQAIFTAKGKEDDPDIAWDLSKEAWQACAVEKLGPKWTFPSAEPRKRCYKVSVSGTSRSYVELERISCNPAGDKRGEWACYYQATPCTTPPRRR